MKGNRGFPLNIMGDEILPFSKHCTYIDSGDCWYNNPNFVCKFMNADRIRCNKVIRK